MRKTKIVCTIGPASSDEQTVKKLCLAGMNVTRMNFSHNTHKEHKQRIETVKRVSESLGLPVAIMLDTKGPEYRIGVFSEGSVQLYEGDGFVFTSDEVTGDKTRVSVSYKNLSHELSEGDTVLVNNGLMSFRVEAVDGADVRCVALTSGVLSDRKSMSFPGKVMRHEYLSDEDRADIALGVELGVDFIACSFVSNAQNIRDVKEYLKSIGAEGIELIAKIENGAGIENIESICAECAGIMIGRGDMGVEIPFTQLPAIQKRIITKCRMLGKLVITATEMLESMISNIRPTRAEISDVANAVFDGTSAVMLSGETAAGKYPVLATETMARIAEDAEANINYKKRFKNQDFSIENTVDALSHATCTMAIDVDAKCIAVSSISGKTVRMVSRFRSPADIIGMTTDRRAWRQLNLSWGVTPVMSDEYTSLDIVFYQAMKHAVDIFSLKSGDNVVLTGGLINGNSGNTNTIKVESVK